MYSDTDLQHCMCKPYKWDTKSCPSTKLAGTWHGRWVSSASSLDSKWLADYDKHSNVFNEMTAKHSTLLLVVWFTSEKHCNSMWCPISANVLPTFSSHIQPHFLDVVSHSAWSGHRSSLHFQRRFWLWWLLLVVIIVIIVVLQVNCLQSRFMNQLLFTDSIYSVNRFYASNGLKGIELVQAICALKILKINHDQSDHHDPSIYNYI